ncbi:MAG: LD-carboxypeptidase [Victivallales bacterium]|jgi:muramoyltetrapeptide carboxypeptidase
MIKNPFPENIGHVAIVSLAGKPKREAVASTSRLLKGFGIRTSVMPNVFAPGSGEKLPAGCELRISDFNMALNDNSVDLILSSRGGYGSAQLLDNIDWRLLKEKNLPVLGYSDITAFHLAMFAKKAGIAISSPMASELPIALKHTLTWESLSSSLSPSSEKIFPLPEKFKLKTLRGGKAAGKIIPVNLTVLASMLGTPYLPDFKGAVLLVEDLCEPVYKIDRYLTHLRLAGVLKELSALLFGNFRRCGNEREREKTFAEFADAVNGPVISGIPFGHVKRRLCLRFGAEVVIDSDNFFALQKI